MYNTYYQYGHLNDLMKLDCNSLPHHFRTFCKTPTLFIFRNLIRMLSPYIILTVKCITGKNPHYYNAVK